MPRPKTLTPRNCEVCGSEFQPHRSTHRTCSVLCRAQLPHNTGGSRPKKGLASRCCQNPECGQEFIPVRENQIACSRQCLLKCPSYVGSQQRANSKPERRARANEIRRIGESPAPSRSPNYRQLRLALSEDERRAAIALKNRRFNLKRNGWTLEEWDQAYAEQDGYCAICPAKLDPAATRSARAAHADHDHQTKRRRGILCSNCNRGVGCFLDDLVLLRAAAEYIERHRALLNPPPSSRAGVNPARDWAVTENATNTKEQADGS